MEGVQWSQIIWVCKEFLRSNSDNMNILVSMHLCIILMCQNWDLVSIKLHPSLSFYSVKCQMILHVKEGLNFAHSWTSC